MRWIFLEQAVCGRRNPEEAEGLPVQIYCSVKARIHGSQCISGIVWCLKKDAGRIF